MAIGFAGKELKRIAELEAELTARKAGEAVLSETIDRRNEEMRALKESHEVELANLKAQYAESEQVILKINQESRLRKEAEHDQDIAAKDREITLLQGQLEEHRVFSRYAHWLRDHFTWHSGGSVPIGDEVFRLMNAHQNEAGANFRLPIPDWMDW